jgi:hypothetical protein
MERKLADVKREKRQEPSTWVTVHLEIPIWLAIIAIVLSAVFLILSLGVLNG